MFANEASDSLNFTANPLDNVEDVLSSHDWGYTRVTNDELIVQVHGKNCEYRLYFIWQKDMGALQFCCQYDLSIADKNIVEAAKTLMALNENLWMGHFDLPQDTMIPTFRQTLLIQEQDTPTAEHENIHNLIDISMTQCERYFTAFYMLSDRNSEINNSMIDCHNMNLALMETMGES